MVKKRKGEGGTLQDVIDAVNTSSSATAKDFRKLNEKFDKMDSRLQKVEVDVTNIKTSMVTRNHFEKQFSQLEDKVTHLADILHTKNILTVQEYKRVMVVKT